MANDFTFKTASVRSVVSSPTTNITKDQVDNVLKIDKEYLNVLSEKSGLSITNDKVLSEAKNKIVKDLNSTIQQASSSLSSPLNNINNVDSTNTTEPISTISDPLKDALSLAKEYKPQLDIAKQLCEGINDPFNLDLLQKMTDFKNILDFVLDKFDYGFLLQLSNCSFFDTEAMEKTVGTLDNVVEMGDVNMYTVITDIASPSVISGTRNVTNDITALSKKTKDFSGLNSLMSRYDMGTTDLVKDKSLPYIDSLQNIQDISNTNPDLNTHILGYENAKIATKVAEHLQLGEVQSLTPPAYR